MGVVGLGRNPVDLDLRPSTYEVKVVFRESPLAQVDVNGSGVAHVVDAISDDHVLALNQVLILDL